MALALESWLATARAAIETARKFADNDDVQLGWYVLRDLEATKRAGLTDLAWSGHKQGDVTKGELLWFIEELERYLSSANDPDQPRAPEKQ